jgi:hypothetical protein
VEKKKEEEAGKEDSSQEEARALTMAAMGLKFES